MADIGKIMGTSNSIVDFTKFGKTATGSAITFEYNNQRWVVDANGDDANSGKSINLPKKTLTNAIVGINNNTRINIAYGNYVAGININNKDNVDLVGTGVAGKNQVVIAGLNTVTGTATRIGFKDLNIGSNSANTLVTFSDTGGNHVFENVGSNNNTATALIQFGVNSYTNTVPNYITTFGKFVARIFQCDFSTTTGKIVLPDLLAGQYACIQIADSVLAGLSIGKGWVVLHNADVILGTVVYTGGATSAQLILTTP